MPVIDKATFYKRVLDLPPVIPSITNRASYAIKGLAGKTLSFTRVNTAKQWQLDIEVLYHIYCQHTHIDSDLVKRETKGRVNSPMVAVLLAIGCIDGMGRRMG